MFLQYSGILSILSAWVLIVAPAYLYGIDNRKHTISTATQNKQTKQIITFGLLLGSFLQFLFLTYLSQKLQISYSNPGYWLYLSTIFASLTAALFTEQKHTQIHRFAVKYYFLIHPATLVLICMALINSSYAYAFWFSLCLIIINYIGLWWLHQKYGKNALLELWVFLNLSILTIFLTLV